MFEGISFNGTFRTYQQRIIDKSDSYLSDGHMHIVAAPGSGKTILGLELIRRLNLPCIILSPTTTIRSQWGERFVNSFKKANYDLSSYFSYSLNHLAPITSVTYQALHAAMNKIKDEEDDYSKLELVKAVKEYGVGTICLDEAHHLRSEWQIALENFLKELGENIKIIALTATPPYDAKPNEWKRYIDVCGEIDEEIFVPELVKQGTLCPHQDYIYFNYPDTEEIEVFSIYRECAYNAIDEFIKLPILNKAYKKFNILANDYDFLYTYTKENLSLIALFNSIGLKVSKKITKYLTAGKQIPKLSLERMEVAINFLIKNDDICNEEDRESIKTLFAKSGLTDRGEVALDLNEKLKRKLISSVGKLKSIAEISKSENNSLGKRLRLLILTDYIKKDSLSSVGNGERFNEVSIVSVFETVRNIGIKVGALSGALTILPENCISVLQAKGIDFTFSELNKTGYYSINFKGSNIDKVHYVSSLFEEGHINVLVGTKSLLGEGWDAPCVNSLILASFVGSFMLSNQMRGRAIRVDKNNLADTANIWHLVTVEPEYLFPKKLSERITEKLLTVHTEIKSYDFETLSRRFVCFVGPRYDSDVIQSGFQRISNIKPPFNKNGIEAINNDMLKRSRERQQLKESWDNALAVSEKVNKVSEVPPENHVPAFTFYNVLMVIMLSSVMFSCLGAFINSFFQLTHSIDGAYLLFALLMMGIFAVSTFCLLNILINKMLRHISPTRSIRTLAQCIADTLIELRIISADARVVVNSDPGGIVVQAELKNASIRDTQIFHTAIKELLSPIKNPRYLLIPRALVFGLRYSNALACPEILASKAEYANCFIRHLKKSMGKMEAIYTRNENGRKLILKCRKRAYITRNAKELKTYEKVD
ncbi:MAG: DEAD/DEAH box helicase family protein [Clostridiales bacterium]|nr:DEAD/DEAH box helicase family protein [Clostridiales bacterium]